jgi:adenylate kinase
MSLKRSILFYTSSIEKINDIINDFKHYDITVIQIVPQITDILQNPENLTIENYNEITSQHMTHQRHKILGIIIEQTKLLRKNYDFNESSEIFTNLEEVKHYSQIKFITTEFNKIKIDIFETYTDGFIDLSHSNPERKKYGWDDIFIVKKSLQSYLEALDKGQKISSRNINISKLIEKYIYYKSRKDLVYNAQNFIKTIDFSHNLQEYFNNIPDFNTEYMKKMKIINIIRYAYNQGLFFRSGITRRQTNYWCPGLNAGIPFIGKPKDSKHELTFQFHDISHFNIPDLIPDFSDKIPEPIQKLIYVSYRLVSEAITLVLGDMIFVNSLFESGINYETVSQRKIYQIFQQIMKNNSVNDSFELEKLIYKILHGSLRYCFYKDISEWKILMGNTDESSEILETFQNKYDSYFMEDFKWTIQNYKYMYSNYIPMKKWWKNVKDFRKIGKNLELDSVSEFITQNNIDITSSKEQIIEKIFDSIYNKYIKRIFTSDIQDFNYESNITNAFIRYIMGQSCLFFTYGSDFYISDKYFNMISNFIKGDINIQTINNCRNFYATYLTTLAEHQYISLDDMNTYEQVYPLFNPSYIDYDNFKTNTTLDIYVQTIL